MARVRCARSALDVRAVLRLYVERVPEVGFEDSCIFHGKQGCTLDRSLRSDVCNSYFCSGLQVYMTGADAVTPAMIIAGVGDQMRTSPILMPKEIRDRFGILPADWAPTLRSRWFADSAQDDDSATAERSAGEHAHPHRAFRLVNQ